MTFQPMNRDSLFKPISGTYMYLLLRTDLIIEILLTIKVCQPVVPHNPNITDCVVRHFYVIWWRIISVKHAPPVLQLCYLLLKY